MEYQFVSVHMDSGLDEGSATAFINKWATREFRVIANFQAGTRLVLLLERGEPPEEAKEEAKLRDLNHSVNRLVDTVNILTALRPVDSAPLKGTGAWNVSGLEAKVQEVSATLEKVLKESPQGLGPEFKLDQEAFVWA
ncbi:MAG: hypothetical protein Q8O97_01000, partial [bacterium]|nr:hypothetical protein [bacterium]